MDIVAFHPRHLELIELRDYEKNGVFQLNDAFERFAKVTAGSVASGTFLEDGRVLFCAGFNKIWDGVFEVWMVPSVHITKTPFLFCKVIKRYLERVEKDFKAHRIQTTSYDDPFHVRWMNWIGFEKEGTMRKLMPNKTNMCMYARVS